MDLRLAAGRVAATARGLSRGAVALLGFLGGGLGAADLVGIPVPGRVSTPHWELSGGDTDLGAGGGGSGDDWRVGHGAVACTEGWFSAAIDYSALTSQNPSRAPIYWGQADPFLQAHQGAGRSDEITAAVAARTSHAGAMGLGWLQAGPGVQLSGDFGGKSLQNHFHEVIGNDPNDLDYEHPALRATAFVHAGAGDRMPLIGPFALDARALGMVTASGWSRWRGELLLFATHDDHGAWVGLRQDGATGHALTHIADAVAQHESGLGITCGMSWTLGAWQLSCETYHNLSDDGQDGLLTLGYRPSAVVPASACMPEGVASGIRMGLCGQDSLVPGHGIDIVATSTVPQGLPRWLDLALGFRDQDLHLPYTYDLSGRRLMLWGGLATDQVLLGGAHASIDACGEAGVGVRSASVTSHGFVDVDGTRSRTLYSPLARAATGVGAWAGNDHSRYGLVGLVEATLAPRRSATLQVHDPSMPGIIRAQQRVALDGDSIGAVAGLCMVWSW